MSELVFYRCAHCGNIAWKLIDSGVPMVCCGEEMQALKANTVDAAQEKHVPVISRDGDTVTVAVGSVTHPMEEKHYIQFIALVTDDSVVVKHLRPGDEPKLAVKGVTPVAAYEYCNIHGLWKGENQ